MAEPVDPQFLPSVSQSVGDEIVEVDPDVRTITTLLTEMNCMYERKHLARLIK
ncbi:hypothetical protein GP486_004379 [Trichoglossum hirsutum]|uniref:Uncharacterized protein n=1 Tax=Trichoglossum hirsutum TaxID=265104 RepID=A0A9P8RP80_9PEZI|nr:hypothetical protein GP486_004379 [Trichoglossum hirsutum]